MATDRDDRSEIADAYALATSLERSGDDERARATYLELLGRDPEHPGALNSLGCMLDRSGFPVAARTAFAQAVAAHPNDPTSHGNLATHLFDAGEDSAARYHYEKALELAPDHVSAHACLAIMDLRAGNEAAAAAHARIGYHAGVTTWPLRGPGSGVPVLVVHSALGGNVQLERYLDDRVFAKSTLVAEFFDPRRPLPPHRLAVNAIGDADRAARGLHAARAILAGSTAPVINLPEHVLATGRAVNAARLGRLTGVRTPQTVVRTRAQLMRPDSPDDLAAAGVQPPFIVRAAGYHTGLHCTRVETYLDLEAKLEHLPGNTFMVLEYIDVGDRHGFFRKLRVMCIDGVVFPLHLAIGTHWKVHYFSADMQHCAEHRVQEAAFLGDMQAYIGPAACMALGSVARTLSLHYGGIDFALDRDGRVVVFEANATMVVAPPPPDARWAYRRHAVERIDAAVRTLLHGLGGSTSPIEAHERRGSYGTEHAAHVNPSTVK